MSIYAKHKTLKLKNMSDDESPQTAAESLQHLNNLADRWHSLHSANSGAVP